jgi:hypothetical protein
MLNHFFQNSICVRHKKRAYKLNVNIMWLKVFRFKSQNKISRKLYFTQQNKLKNLVAIDHLSHNKLGFRKFFVTCFVFFVDFLKLCVLSVEI